MHASKLLELQKDLVGKGLQNMKNQVILGLVLALSFNYIVFQAVKTSFSERINSLLTGVFGTGWLKAHSEML